MPVPRHSPLLPTHGYGYSNGYSSGYSSGYSKRNGQQRQGRSMMRLMLMILVVAGVVWFCFASTVFRKISQPKGSSHVTQEDVPAAGDSTQPHASHSLDVEERLQARRSALHEATQELKHPEDKDFASEAGNLHNSATATGTLGKSSELVTETKARAPSIDIGRQGGSRAPMVAQGLYALAARDAAGVEQQLSAYAGSVTLVVNVASQCGYTDSNYKGLQALYEKYGKHGFNILAFPCNQFGQQEPGSEAEIVSFCTSRYHTTFPLFAKVDVNGPQAHPVYQFLKRFTPASQGGGGGTSPGQDIQWNFAKFLVDTNGQPVRRWGSDWNGPAVEKEVYALLAKAKKAASAA